MCGLIGAGHTWKAVLMVIIIGVGGDTGLGGPQVFSFSDPYGLCAWQLILVDVVGAISKQGQ